VLGYIHCRFWGSPMKRREFIAMLGSGALIASGSTRAQQDRIRHIGMLMGYAEADPDTQARKLAVIMHTMLKTGELFNPNAGAAA